MPWWKSQRSCFNFFHVSNGTHEIRMYRGILRYATTQVLRARSILHTHTHTHKLQESVNGWLVVKVGDFFFPAGSEMPSSVGKNEGFQFPVIPTENQYKAEIQGLRYKTLTRLIPFCFAQVTVGFSFDVQLIVGVPFAVFLGRDLVTGGDTCELFVCPMELGGYSYGIVTNMYIYI